MERTNASLIEILKGYFNIFADKEDEGTVIGNITNGVHFRGAQLWILIFAVFIASLGLNINSTAVVIGAMLISPLMGPIIGMGLAVGINVAQRESMRKWLQIRIKADKCASDYSRLYSKDKSKT